MSAVIPVEASDYLRLTAEQKMDHVLLRMEIISDTELILSSG